MTTDYTETIIKKLSDISALEEYPIPHDVREKEVILEKGRCKIETIAYKNDMIEKACFSKMSIKSVRGNAGTVFPSDDFDFPIFAYDVEDYGDSILAIADLKPLRRQDKLYCDKYVEPQKEIYEKYKDINTYETRADWTKEFVSGFGLRAKGGKDIVEKISSAFFEYLDLYLSFIKDANPIEDKKAREESLKFKTHCRDTYFEKDPGRGPTIKFFGEEWGNKYLRLLF